MVEVSRICKDFQLDKVSKVVVGGRERTDSVLAGLREVRPDADLIIKICQMKNFAGSFVFSKSQRKWERLSARGKNGKEKPLLHGWDGEAKAR